MTDILNQIAEKWFSWQLSMFWQVGLLIAIVAGLDLIIKKWAWPQVRYALWLLILIKLILPPSLTSPTSFTAEIPFIAKEAAIKISQSQTIPQTIETSQKPIGPTPANITAQSAETISAPIAAPAVARLSLKAYVFSVWLAGVVILSGWLIIRLSNLRHQHLKDKQSNLPERLEGLLASTAQKLNLRKIPQVILTNKICCPAVFGIIRPVLLMPADKLANLTTQDTENIFLHELAHIKRGDLLVHAIYMILQIAYWFNPLLWLIRKQLQNLRELCCDATVAKILREKTAGYRQTLLETARQLLAQPVDPGLGLLGLFENSNWLVDRLGWLEKKSWRYRPLRIATIFVLVCLMAACVLPMTKFEAPADFVIKGTVTDAQTGKPISGATVGDTENYADGKYHAITDGNGNYSYKTWYEEHGIMATADDYQKERKTLLTKLFGSEKEKVIDFALEPNATDKQTGSKTGEKEKLQKLVEDFFKDNYRDIKQRKTIEWGEPIIDANGSQTIRYKYEARIWDKDKYIFDELFTFSKDGKFISAKKLSQILTDYPADKNSSAGQGENEISVFESYFPVDEEAGKKLDEWWKNKDTVYLDTDTFFELFRKGIRKCTIEYKGNFPMQYIGGKYISHKEPDDQKAIDIVYYASFSPEYKYYAVYSGLSVANPKSEKVLKRLVDIALEYHQLGRIIWGVKQSKQDNKFIAFLEPYLHSSDPVKREHADIVIKAFRGEIDGNRWEREWNQKQRTEKTIREFGDDLSKIKKTFLTGTSAERREAFKFVKRNGITLFHDASFIAALGECVKDSDANIRAETARLLGNNFIWGQYVQPEEAIEILLRLSKDQSRDVRYQVVYFGLSVITNKDEQIIKRLVEMALDESNSHNFADRIRWGLTHGANKEVIKKYLDPYLSIEDKKGELARNLYKEIYKEEPFMQTRTKTPTGQGVYPIDFEITKQAFLQGDSIEITEILANTDNIETGQTYTIKGKYKLSSADSARLHIYATNGEIDSEQGPLVKRGTGDFTRIFTYKKAGWLHLSFYPADGGGSFGSLYFAKKGSGQKMPDISTITSVVGTPKPDMQIENDAIKNQLQTKVDLPFSPDMPFSEAIEILKHSVNPPLNIIVIWNNLDNNACVERKTRIGLDPMSGVPLNLVLKLLLKSVYQQCMELDYAIMDGTIVIDTESSLQRIVETNAYNTEDPNNKTDVQIEVEGDKYNLMARGGKSRVEALNPKAANLINLYLHALEKSDWKTALSVCSISVIDKAQQYPTAESFFNTVVPVKEILNKLRDPRIGYWQQAPKYFAYIFDVRISQPDLPRDVFWVWKARKLEGKANWEIDFPAIPFKTWLADERQEIFRVAQEKDRLIKELAPRLKGVRTLLTTKRKEFVVGEPIYFSLQLVNQGDSILNYDCQQVAVNNSMTIEGPEGKEVKYMAEYFQTNGSAVIIKPGETKTLFDQFDITKQYDIRQPGEYRVQFNGNGLSIGVGKEDTSDLNDSTSFEYYPGILPSNMVIINVRSGHQARDVR